MHLIMFYVRLLPMICSINLSGIHISSANSFRKKGCHLSGPWDLFAFKVFSFFHTRSGVLVIFDNISPLNSSVGSGITIFSTVNMLLKYLFSAFALSSGDTAFVPSGLSSAGMEALVFNLDFAYFQNDLGFSFTLS